MSYSKEPIRFNIEGKLLHMNSGGSSIAEIRNSMLNLVITNNNISMDDLTKELHETLGGHCMYSSSYRAIMSQLHNDMHYTYVDPDLLKHTRPVRQGGQTKAYSHDGLDDRLVLVLHKMFSRMSDDDIVTKIVATDDGDVPSLKVVVRPKGNPDKVRIYTTTSGVGVELDITDSDLRCTAKLCTFDRPIEFYLTAELIGLVMDHLRDLYVTPHEFPEGLLHKSKRHIVESIKDDPIFDGVDYDEVIYDDWSVDFVIDSVKYVAVMRSHPWEGLNVRSFTPELRDDPLRLVQVLELTKGDFNIVKLDKE